jgi:hypothetical protein
MRPDDRDLDEEIRSHLALSVRERIERGEDPSMLWVGAGLAMAAAVLLAFVPRLPSPQCLANGSVRIAARVDVLQALRSE